MHSKSFNSKSKKKLDGSKKNHPVNVGFPPIKPNKKDGHHIGKKTKKKVGHLHSEFKHSLKHNSSNHSITGKKIIPSVKKIGEHKKFYSPYS